MVKPKLQHALIADIKDESGATEVCISISGVPHIKFVKKKYIGLMSWYESKQDFRIEIYLKGRTILCEYNSFEKWKVILNIINDQV